ncbi:MAG: futalosine hydrolase [Planctomyces sp.]|nr:futalosine hydrolase [Planctomyces sp.]
MSFETSSPDPERTSEPLDQIPLLVLIPTPLESSILNPLIGDLTRAHSGVIELCGFGPISAAARTSQLLARYRPARVVLLGIAGGIGSTSGIGSATTFRRVACAGIGVGQSDQHQSASELGWLQWSGSSLNEGTEATASVGDAISIGWPEIAELAPQYSSGTLITVTSASRSFADVQLWTNRYPDATAEDMEGYGVALSCHLHETPLEIVRGISNPAGNRDKRCWNIRGALEAAADRLAEILKTQKVPRT